MPSSQAIRQRRLGSTVRVLNPESVNCCPSPKKRAWARAPANWPSVDRGVVRFSFLAPVKRLVKGLRSQRSRRRRRISSSQEDTPVYVQPPHFWPGTDIDRGSNNQE